MALTAADLAEAVAVRNSGIFDAVASGPADAAERLSPHAAVRSARQAMRRVPAYRRYLADRGWRDDPSLDAGEWLRTLPETNKDDYVKAYDTAERCLDGTIPMAGTLIDESAGSSGTPYNWVRSERELRELHRAFGQYVRHLYGENLLVINAFSMGAWATGTNVGEALRANGMIKSTGPDIDRIEGTMRFFGPGYRYLITGYPPFLKELIDVTAERGLPWDRYECHALVGGEGMGEGLRDYLLTRLRTVYSAYGASDLDIGIGGELRFTVALRRTAAEDDDLRQALFGEDPRLPMVFAYNPLDYFIETNERGELLVTINRLSVLSPRIRYNVLDAGGVIGHEDVAAILASRGVDLDLDSAHPVFRLPILFLFGRSDQTISYMGANIYPADIEAAIYADATDARCIEAFATELMAVENGEERPCIHVALDPKAPEDPDLAARLRERIVDRLMTANRDFRDAVGENPQTAEVQVRLHRNGEGPFAGGRGAVKQRRVVRPS